jgi:restriction endonuclease Mrr
MLIDNMLAYSEIDEILNLLEDKYKEKIPENVRNFFKEERNNDYIPKIDTKKPLIEQNLKRETLILLAILNLNYWCENEEEKQEFLNQLAENEKRKKELEEKYNPDNLFKNKAKNSNANNLYEENLQMIEYKKPNFIQRLLDKIVKFFKM